MMTSAWSLWIAFPVVYQRSFRSRPVVRPVSQVRRVARSASRYESVWGNDRDHRSDYRVSPPRSRVMRIFAAILVASVLSACASLTVADTVALPSTAMAPPGSNRISSDGYRLDSLADSPDTPDLSVLVAMSGGGKRSASFAHGALKGMREVSVPTRAGAKPLLQEVDGIAGVSGGSFPAAYYGLYRDEAFGRFETDLLYRDTESYIWGIYLLPWNWTWLADPLVGTNDFMERVYDQTMFHGANFVDLQKRRRPIIAINATDLSYGSPFMFTQEGFDLICSDLASFRWPAQWRRPMASRDYFHPSR
jgi:predicted acylesterase/phospholipase RssA